MKFEIVLFVLVLATAISIIAESFFKGQKKADLKEQQHDQSPENYKRF